MRILLIEDNQPLALTIVDELAGRFMVEAAHTGQAGLDLSCLNTYDLVIIDISLPDISGLTICTQLREQGSSVPILMLTGESLVTTKVTALNSGADDYLTKPFDFDELVARIQALLRRHPPTLSSNILTAGDLQLDLNTRQVTRGRHQIKLRRKELYLLEYLLRNTGRLITRTMIFEHVWDSRSDVIANVVDVQIKHLRQQIDEPFSTKLIKTVHGLGYKLEI